MRGETWRAAFFHIRLHLSFVASIEGKQKKGGKAVNGSGPSVPRRRVVRVEYPLSSAAVIFGRGGEEGERNGLVLNFLKDGQLAEDPT